MCQHSSQMRRAQTLRLSLPVPPLRAVQFLAFFCWEIFSARTCFTHFCSSIRKARRTRFRTQVPHFTPPYARVTWRSRCFRRFLSYGRTAATPWSFPPHSPHLTYLAIFLTRCRTFRPPGVFTTSTLLLLVL